MNSTTVIIGLLILSLLCDIIIFFGLAGAVHRANQALRATLELRRHPHQ
jgi:nucleoside phosphorylase